MKEWAMKQTLIPFHPSPYPLVFDVEASLQPKSPSLVLLSIAYHVTGEAINEINLLSEPLTQSERAHDLWKNTCFEWFLKTNTASSSRYWEFNAAPTGAWNFYELASYRAPLRESPFLSHPKFQSQFTPGDSSSNSSRYSFLFQGELNPLLMESSPKDSMVFQLAITSVIKWKSDAVSYYSLRHPKEKPDFHSPEGFVLSLPLS